MDDKKEKLHAIMNRMKLAGKLRLMFLVIAATLLTVLYVGSKVWTQEAFFHTFRTIALLITICDLFFMVIATFTKLFFTVQYNKAVKQS